MNIRTLTISTIASLAMAAVGTVATMSVATAQDAAFSNASIRGTYAVVHLNSNPGGPWLNHTAMSLVHYDGEGNIREVRVYRNRAGELDENGNFTRNIDVTADDPDTWQYISETYQVHSSGAINHFSSGEVVGDGVITRTEMIDGVLTAVEWLVVTRQANGRNGGGSNMFRGMRIADGDTLPPAPAE